MIAGVVFVLAGILIGAAIVMGNREIQAKMSAWQSLAVRTGLSYRPGDVGLSPSLEGEYEDRPVSVGLVVLSTGKGERTHTRVSALVKNAKALSLCVARKGGPGDAKTCAGRLGLAAVTTGDPDLDLRFEIHASDGAAAKRVLSEKIRKKLLWEDRIRLAVDGHRATLDVRDAVNDEERLRLLLDLAGLVAGAVETE
ncbi:MAG: hypothetical protein HY720_33120 [Planctomycetes bacterium]|nr:hypothetical protein [Planctomycetota bacterium]